MVKKIELTRGKFALVDNVDYSSMIQYKWHANQKKLKSVEDIWYAKMYVKLENGHGTTKDMHRLIMEKILEEKGDLELLKKFKQNPRKYPVDHIDSNGLNNQRSNLRIVTHRQNMQNLTKKKFASKYPGVYWDKHREKWAVKIRVGSTGSKWVGRFDSEEEAFKAYKKAIKDDYNEEVI